MGIGFYGKRDADAEPQLIHGYGYGAGLKSAPCVNAYNHPVPCNGYAGYGVGIYGKREADAEPQLSNGYAGYGVYGYGKRDADPQIYGGVGIYGGYAHAIAATPYGLTHSSNVGVCHNFVGAQVPC